MDDLTKFYVLRGYWDLNKPPKYLCQEIIGEDNDIIYGFTFANHLVGRHYPDESLALFKTAESIHNFLKSRKIYGIDDMIKLEIVAGGLEIEVIDVD